MDKKIKFGTSGWRGIIAEDFTFPNVRKVTRAIIRFMREKGYERNGVVVGYDTRFLSKEFAMTVSTIFAENGIKVYFTEYPTPTPVISFEIIKKGTGGGVNITASHNPFYYSGIKYSPPWGGPAEPEVTKMIEKFIPHSSSTKPEGEFDDYVKSGVIEIFDPLNEYVSSIKEVLPFNFDFKKPVIFDVLFGTGARYVKELFKGFKNIKLIHDRVDPLFGGLEPVPYEHELKELKEYVKRERAIIGLALDGDSDRFGVISSDGTFITPNEVISIISYFFIPKWKREVKKSLGIGRTVSTTRLLDEIASYFNIPLYETPVGFKYIGMLIRDEKIFIGGEESGGLSIHGWLPEKDGILANLLVLGIVEDKKLPPKDLIEEVYKKFGRFYTHRIDIRFREEEAEKVVEFINKFDKDLLFGLKVKEINRKDGLLIKFEDGVSWVLLRKSGTENVIRFYFESKDKTTFKTIEEKSKSLIDYIMKE